MVSASIPAAGLDEASLESEDWVPRSDKYTEWNVHETSWKLPIGARPGQVASQIARTINSAFPDPSLSHAPCPDLEIYRTPSGSLALELRIYADQRLASLVNLEPTLSLWPPVIQDQPPPLLAILVRHADVSPQKAQSLFTIDHPISIALSPYSPFSLRLSRDAISADAEVLVEAGPDIPLADSINDVPNASGVLLTCPPKSFQQEDIRALEKAGMYLVDACPDGLGTNWTRRLQEAGVEYVRGIAFSSQLESIPLLHHQSLDHGAAVLVVDLEDAFINEMGAELEAAARHGYRPAFVAEVSNRLNARNTATR